MTANRKPRAVAVCAEIARPVAEAMGLSLWDVRFEKEGGDFFLRYFIDRPDGVTMDELEQFSRAVGALLDAADPIDRSYCLEVSSPGTERALREPAHFAAFVGRAVTVKLYAPAEGRREYTGRITAFDAESGTVALDGGAGGTHSFKLADIASARQYAEYNFRGDDR